MNNVIAFPPPHIASIYDLIGDADFHKRVRTCLKYVAILSEQSNEKVWGSMLNRIYLSLDLFLNAQCDEDGFINISISDIQAAENNVIFIERSKKQFPVKDEMKLRE